MRCAAYSAITNRWVFYFQSLDTGRAMQQISQSQNSRWPTENDIIHFVDRCTHQLMTPLSQTRLSHISMTNSCTFTLV